MGILIDVIIDTISDVLKIIPFLFLIYLFLEFMEHEVGHKMEHVLEKHRRLNPLLGTLFGMLPTCGFPSAASSLYASGVISTGTLIAVYLASSDEMLSIMLSAQAPMSKVLPILAVKLIVGLIAGYTITAGSQNRNIDVDSLCRREHDDHSHGIFASALLHTAKITVWLVLITFLFNFAVQLIGVNTLTSFIASHPNQSVLASTLVGMIPSCASSVLLSTMYLDGVIPFASVCAGLLVNAGTGMLVLWRVNPDWKDNLRIFALTWLCGFIAGMFLQFIGLSF